MVQLLALGKLEGLTTFPTHDVSEELLVKTLYLKTPYEEACYKDLLDLLEAKGRHDLVAGIHRVIARYHETDIRGILKRFGRNYLNLTFPIAR